MRRKLVAGNWKMNTNRAEAKALASAVAATAKLEEAGVEVLICPPFPYLCEAGAAIQGSAVVLGAQDVYFEPNGAFTGEISVAMLTDVGSRYVLVGHSERRHVLGETDDLLNKKLKASLAGGLRVVLCVGEKLDERGSNQTNAVLDAQMAGGLAGVSDAELDRVVIAYEPVWAIGTGKTASTEQAEAAHAHLRKWLATRYNPQIAESQRILYGGSVKADNALALLSQPNVDGALVGGACLKPELFVPIIEAARKAIG